MGRDSLRESGCMSMDVDDSSYCHPPRNDSVEMTSPGSSAGRPSFDLYNQSHELGGPVQRPIRSLPSRRLPDREGVPGSDHSHREPASAPSAVTYPGEMDDIHQNHGLATRPGAFLPDSRPSVQDTEVAPCKRKHFHDLPEIDVTPHDDGFTEVQHARPRRRTRPRLRRQQDGEFSPLLIMSPHSSSPEEETISMFHYPPNPTDAPLSIQRYFHPDHPLLAHAPRILPRTSLPPVGSEDDANRPEESTRSDSASSLAEVALARTAHGRLSTLSDIYLPRPFDDSAGTSSSQGAAVKVHARGLDAPPALRLDSIGGGGGGRMGGLRASREVTGARGHPIRPPVPEHESSVVKFFDGPLCESPDEISPEDGVKRFELPATGGMRVDSIARAGEKNSR